MLLVAAQEGVTALAHERLAELSAPCPELLRSRLAQAARQASALSLLVQSETRRILDALSKAGLSTLLLKGSALAYWLYPTPQLRECGDIDLLLASRDDAEKASSILQSLGYQRREAHLPGDLVTFEFTCVLDGGIFPGLEVDIHWRLSSSPIYAFHFDNDELWASAQPLPRLSGTARGLSRLHAYQHACLHRMLNIPGRMQDTLKWLNDIHLLGKQFSPTDWQLLIIDARKRGLAGTCLHGLVAAEDCFGAVAPAHVEMELAAAARSESMDVGQMSKWLYLQRLSFLAFPTWRDRIRWLRQRLVPDWNYLVDFYGKDTSAIGLLGQRLAGGWKRLVR